MHIFHGGAVFCFGFFWSMKNPDSSLTLPGCAGCIFYDALSAPLTGFMRCEVTAVKLKVQCYGGLQGKKCTISSGYSAIAASFIQKKKVGCFRGFVLSMIFFKSMAILINKTFCHNRRAKLWFSGTIKRGTLNIQRPFSSITGSCVRQDSPCRRLNTAHVLKCFSMSLPVTRIHTSIKWNNVQVGITCTNAT